jgi:hypothetical protein
MQQPNSATPVLINKSPIRVIYVRPVYATKTNTLNEICHICQKHLEQRCNDCSINNILCCKVIIGSCHHAFHNHCMKEWLTKNNNCPVDMEAWSERTAIVNDNIIIPLQVPPIIGSVQNIKGINDDKSKRKKSHEMY